MTRWAVLGQGVLRKHLKAPDLAHPVCENWECSHAMSPESGERASLETRREERSKSRWRLPKMRVN